MARLEDAAGEPRRHGDTKKIREARAVQPLPDVESVPTKPAPRKEFEPTGRPPTPQEASEEFPGEFAGDEGGLEDVVESGLGEQSRAQGAFPYDQVPDDLATALWRAHMLTNISLIPGIDKGFADLANRAWDEVDRLSDRYGLGGEIGSKTKRP